MRGRDRVVSRCRKHADASNDVRARVHTSSMGRRPQAHSPVQSRPSVVGHPYSPCQGEAAAGPARSRQGRHARGGECMCLHVAGGVRRRRYDLTCRNSIDSSSYPHRWVRSAHNPVIARPRMHYSALQCLLQRWRICAASVQRGSTLLRRHGRLGIHDNQMST